MKMQKIKRVTIGGYVKADVTGTGVWLIGVITKFDKKHIWFDPANPDDNEEVQIMRDQAIKATKTEYDEIANNPEIQDDDEGPKTRLYPDLDHYVVGGDDGRTVTITNRKTVDIDDPVAVEFRAKPIDDVYRLTARYLRNMGYTNIGKKDNQAPVTVDGLRSRYEHLNLGMQRMNLGNLVRNGMAKLGLTDLPINPAS